MHSRLRSINKNPRHDLMVRDRIVKFYALQRAGCWYYPIGASEQRLSSSYFLLFHTIPANRFRRATKHDKTWAGQSPMPHQVVGRCSLHLPCGGSFAQTSNLAKLSVSATSSSLLKARVFDWPERGRVRLHRYYVSVKWNHWSVEIVQTHFRSNKECCPSSSTNANCSGWWLRLVWPRLSKCKVDVKIAAARVKTKPWQ